MQKEGQHHERFGEKKMSQMSQSVNHLNNFHISLQLWLQAFHLTFKCGFLNNYKHFQPQTWSGDMLYDLASFVHTYSHFIEVNANAKNHFT